VNDPYFVRQSAVGPGAGAATDDFSEDPETRARPRYRGLGRGRLVLLALLAVVAGWLLWASRTEGGISARVEDGLDSIRSAVGLDDTDPTLRNAEEAFGDVWDAQGNYLTGREQLQVLMPEIDWVSDLDYEICPGARATVLVVHTAGGIRSRLLLDGERIGHDVEGTAVCPTDYADPAPWER